MDILHQAVNQLLQSSPWEMVAVALAIAYLLLAMKESQWCWYCAFLSTAIYTLLFWHVSLLMESALNVFYMVMAVYGWWEWKYGGARHEGVSIHRWQPNKHLIGLVAVAMVTLVSGYLLVENTWAARPYVDSFTTWASVVTTWMVARKVLENWLYWIVIDSVSVFLYLDRGLQLTALLFVVYVIIAIFGYFNWRDLEKSHREQSGHPATA